MAIAEHKSSSWFQHHMRTGVSGVFVAGTNGESYSMSIVERKRLLEAWLATQEVHDAPNSNMYIYYINYIYKHNGISMLLEAWLNTREVHGTHDPNDVYIYI